MARKTAQRAARAHSDTRERLLDAAERLFAERGFEGTSMRALAREAGASLSAANYHFGSKEALLEATLLRRIEPLNRLRLERLQALEEAVPGSGLEIEAILDAYLRPLFELRAASARAGRTPEAARVSARLYSDPSELVSQLKRQLVGEVNARYVGALQRALPDRNPHAIEIAHQLTTGMLVHVLIGHVDALAATGAPGGFEPLLDTLIAYAAAGLRSTPRAEPGLRTAAGVAP